MNEFEKQVFNSLSEEEQEKIAGGGDINPDDDLTPEQCDELRNAATKAEPGVPSIVPQTPNLTLKYGGPNPHWPTKPTKPLQPLNPPGEPQTSAPSNPGTTDQS